MTSAPAGAQRTDIGLGWGVRASFVRYVVGSGGSVQPFDGAGLITAGGFYFPVTEVTSSNGEEIVHGAGGVAFEAHGGALRIEIANPELRFGADGAVLSLEAAQGGRVLGRVDAFTLTVDEPVESNGVTMWRECATVLTEAGVEIFMNYQAGEAFEPLTVRVPSTWRPAER